eukprot:scaffold300505_cov19-Prasinocladus_malaysianus.AAC.1
MTKTQSPDNHITCVYSFCQVAKQPAAYRTIVRLAVGMYHPCPLTFQQDSDAFKESDLDVPAGIVTAFDGSNCVFTFCSFHPFFILRSPLRMQFTNSFKRCTRYHRLADVVIHRARA